MKCQAFQNSKIELPPYLGVFHGNSQRADIFINKWDANGNFILSKPIAGSSHNESSHAVTLDGDENIYLVGSYSDTVEFDPVNAAGNLTSAGINDAFVINSG
jgi:hypothetical protein